jgi:hypothetical protein
MKRAVQAEMVIIGTDSHPFGRRGSDQPSGPLGLGRLLGGRPKMDDTYAFLGDTPGWTAEEACLAFALTEPALATVQCRTTDPAMLARLAMAVERDLPNGLSAQIEMARFSSHENTGAA